jgi:hypothetical protein
MPAVIEQILRRALGRADMNEPLIGFCMRLTEMSTKTALSSVERSHGGSSYSIGRYAYGERLSAKFSSQAVRVDGGFNPKWTSVGVTVT